MDGPEAIDVEVRALAAGGAGVADLPDGRVVFVPRTAPGDELRIRIVKNKRRWALGEVEHLTHPSPGREAPVCSLYERCGGCALQHIPYEDQLLWKGRFIADALQRIGGLQVAPPPVEASEPNLRYRNRVTFTLRRLRGGRVVAGFHALARPARVVDVKTECVLPEPAITSTWAELRASWGSGARLLPPGGRLSLTLRATADGVVLVVEGGESGWDARDLASAAPSVRAVWHRPSGTEDPELLWGEAAEDRWGVDSFPLAGKAFLQVNRYAGARLVEHVATLAGDGTRAVDAYCGVALYGRALARAGWTVTGIESDAEACRAALQGAPGGLNIREGRVEESLDAALPADLVIVNPPRGGLHPDVASILGDRRPPRVIYVSCDPATLARDVQRLDTAYDLVEVSAFDLFPHTAHVETVAVFQSQDGS